MKVKVSKYLISSLECIKDTEKKWANVSMKTPLKKKLMSFV